MSAQFEKWVPDALGAGDSQMAVFFTALSSTGYKRGQVKFLMENPKAAAKLGVGEEALQDARNAYDGEDWDRIPVTEIRIPE